MHKQSVAVIGGGMAGLSAAYNLQKLGLNATVFERESNVGGELGHCMSMDITWIWALLP